MHKVFGLKLPDVILVSSIIAYSVIFSYLSILKNSVYRSYAWDLGIINQALWTTTHNGRLFYTTLEQYVIPSGAFFGTHFSPILFVILPVYALFPSVNTLLIIQSTVLALAAVPVYLLAKNELSNNYVAAFLSCAYLAYPFVQGINWFDFHVESFLPLFFGFSIYYMRKENWKKFLLFVVLSLSVIEDAAIIVFFMGIYCLIAWRKEIVAFVHRRIPFQIKNIIPFCLIALGASWYQIQNVIKNAFFPFNPTAASTYYASSNWSVLGLSGNPLYLPLDIVLSPGRIVDAIAHDAVLKSTFLFLLFAPLLFIPLRSSYTLLAAPWLVPALLSNYPAYYTIGDQYVAFIIPFLFAALVIGLRLATISSRPRLNLKRICLAVLVLCLVFSMIIGPYSPVGEAILNQQSQLFFSPFPIERNGHVALLDRLVRLVPASGSILTQNNIFVHVSERVNAYALPPDSSFLGGERAFTSYMNQLLNETDFVLVDMQPSYSAPSSLSLFETLSATHVFGVYAYADGAYLFEKGYVSSPVLYVPVDSIYNYANLTLSSGTMKADPGSRSGIVLQHQQSGGSTFWFGPYAILPAGRYTVTFRLTTSSLGQNGDFVLEVTSNYARTILASHVVDSSTYHAGMWTDFTTTFELTEPTAAIEFPCVNVPSSTSLVLDYIQLVQTYPPASG